MLEMTCSCPDWSCLCKHLAAVLYAIGARLDQDPKLFFILRGVSECELIGEQALNTLTEGTTPEINTDQLADVFGMDFDSLDDVNPTPPTDKTPPQNKTITPKSATKSTAKPAAKPTAKSTAKPTAKSAAKSELDVLMRMVFTTSSLYIKKIMLAL